LDRKARFEALVAEHGGAVAKVLTRYAKDRAEAEDLLQEVLFDAWRAFDTLDPARDPRPWLRTLALNRAIDRLRTAASRPVVESGEALERVGREAPPQRADFADEVRGLPPGERAAVLLFYGEGRGVADIAATLGVAAGTVKTWLFRARGRLRARFEDAPRRVTHEDRR
jgi:RNA polymerase sigma-70 factor, ECF subfamily